MPPWFRGSRSLVAALAALGAVGCPGGGDRAAGPTADAGPAEPAASASPGGLSPEAAARVLARVGDRTITLGEYAVVLERMDRFDRLRYQTADRRKALLDEIIELELLAREGERRGLDRSPEVEERYRQILRDELLLGLRERVPRVQDVPASEVRAYYDAHQGELREPERRRISHLVVATRARAEELLAAARVAPAKEWGALVRAHSLDRPGPEIPEELAGDLGFVTPPAAGENDNPRVPEPLRAAAFEIDAPGAVLPRVVEGGGKFHLVRLVARNAARDRTLEEADRTIRVRLVQARLREAERALEAELRARYPVQIDEAALAGVSVPPAQSP